MVIDSMLCQLVRHEDDGIQSLNMLVATMGEIEIVWFCPAEKVALKGLWGIGTSGFTGLMMECRSDEQACLDGGRSRRRVWRLHRSNSDGLPHNWPSAIPHLHPD